MILVGNQVQAIRMSNENKRITQLEELQLANIDPFKPRLERQVVTNLISELKLMYKEIDDLKRQYQSCNKALIETTNWNVRMVEAIDSGKMSEIKRVRNS